VVEDQRLPGIGEQLGQTDLPHRRVHGKVRRQLVEDVVLDGCVQRQLAAQRGDADPDGTELTLHVEQLGSPGSVRIASAGTVATDTVVLLRYC
jgi:hypothetical protein